MRDVSQKVSTLRTAVARSVLRVSPHTIKQIREGTLPKGDPIAVAKVAAIQAAKNTSSIIPYCHPLPVDFVGVDFHLDEDSIEIETTVKAIYKTGVEMEALTAATVAALTIYDMAKMVDEVMQIESVVLVSKTGGKSDFAVAEVTGARRAAVFTLSDSVARGKNKDVSGKILVEALEAEGFEIADYTVLPDDEAEIVPAVRRVCDELKVDLLLTTGGTGLSPRDNTPQAIKRLLDTELPGVSEALRQYGQSRNINAMLSRGVAGLRQKTIIVTLPGSSGGVRDGLKVLFPSVRHAFKMLEGEGHASGHSAGEDRDVEVKERQQRGATQRTVS